MAHIHGLTWDGSSNSQLMTIVSTTTPDGWALVMCQPAQPEGCPLLIGHILDDKAVAGRQWPSTPDCLVRRKDSHDWLFGLLNCGHDVKPIVEG